MIRYFTRTTKATNKRLFEKCVCGADNVDGHAASNCTVFIDAETRRNYLRRIEQIYRKNKLDLKEGLHMYLLDIYFVLQRGTFTEKRDLTSLIKFMEEIILRIGRYRPENKEVETFVSENENDVTVTKD